MQRLQSYGISLVFDAVINHFNLRGGTGQHMLWRHLQEHYTNI